MLSNVSTPLLGVVDTAVVGRLPDPAYIGAVALGALIFNFLFWGFGFLRMGTTGLTAQALGADDAAEQRTALGRALLIALGIGAALIVLQWPIGRLAFALLDGSARVEELAGTYFEVRIWAAPATLPTSRCSAGSSGWGDRATPWCCSWSSTSPTWHWTRCSCSGSAWAWPASPPAR